MPVCLLLCRIGVSHACLALPKHVPDELHGYVPEILHQVETVGHLDDVGRCCLYKPAVPLAAVTADKPDFRVRGNPPGNLAAIAAVEHGKHLPGVMVDGGTHVIVSLAPGEVIYADVPACPDIRVACSQMSGHSEAGGAAGAYVLPFKCG